ncbi:hypothetical protein ROG8370_03782 [Roseovarius gaetbuli]|uniref:Uncharacterized protein n=1 Tax=Roseovarius gaetbuli TaxID=1356575 RepID=A0A1X7AC77_9RHOB|nr:hypothetical protein [Roseovarius gaetbuli]SLN75445.1 hypothetical protein ROG8370_03782 [Roseovarius gaetbuli]
MMEFNLSFTDALDVMLPLAIAFGTLCAFFGLYGAFYSNDMAATRMCHTARARGGKSQRRRLMKTPDACRLVFSRRLCPTIR